MADLQHDMPVFPDRDASLDDLIKYYHKLMYKQTEIRAFLILRYGRGISKTRLRRILQKLELRRNNIESPDILIFEGIQRLHAAGFVDVGYRILWRFLNVNLGLRATQRKVRLIVKILDPEGVSLRKGHRLRRRMYNNGGSNCVVHIDGYDKLKPYGFPIHGAIDGFSRKILWLKVVSSNNNPYSVSRLYFNMIIELGRVPKIIRSDAGTENVLVNEIQNVLRSDHEDVRNGNPCYIVGRSTGNQRIEAFWSFLKKGFTVKWRDFFRYLEQTGLLNLADTDDIENIRLWFTPLLQRELDIIQMYWNPHRIRAQRETELTTGEVPDVLYYQPEMFLAMDCSLPLPCTKAELVEHSIQLSETDPPRGCSEEFFNRISMLSGIPEESFEKADNSEDGVKMYLATRDFLSIAVR